MAASQMMAISPMELPDFQAVAISPDGKLVASDLWGTVLIFNTETLSLDEYLDDGSGEAYGVGMGNAYSDSGILVGSYYGNPAILTNGKWTMLPVTNSNFSNLANGITADGSRICGSVGLAAVSIEDVAVPMLAPAIWELQSDGTYSDPIVLPYPEKDFTGRVPQYVTANVISADGKTIAGQIVDYSGMMIIGIEYKLNNNGEWEYTVLGEDLVNPNHLEFPEYAGEMPPMPDPADFMDEDSRAAYDEAVEEWYNNAMETGDWSGYPEASDYLTEENLEDYNEAKEAYDEAFAEWNVKNEAFSNVFYDCIQVAKPLTFNNVYMMSDGSTIITSTYKEVEDPIAFFGYSNKYTPIKFNTEDGAYEIMESEESILPSGISDNGTILACTDNSYPRVAMVWLPEAEEAMTLVEYMEARTPSTADWMKENMFHDFVYTVRDEDWNMEEVMDPDVDMTGSPIATPDLSLFVTRALNLWDYTTDVNGYILPDTSTGVMAVADTKCGVRALKGGKLFLTGVVLNVTVVDTNGRVVFNATPNSNVIETGLAAGAYIVKVTTAEGNKVIKAVF